MGNFYFDESIHDDANFIIGAFVYSATNLNELGAKIFEKSGLAFGNDEFKSSNITDGDESRLELRNAMKEQILHQKIGFLVTPVDNRNILGDEAIKCLEKIIENNNLSDESHHVYFDESIGFSDSISKLDPNKIQIHTDQKSHEFLGIQLADLCAHTLSIMLREQLGLICKAITHGSNAGFEPEVQMPLGYEMWATLRYSFFTQDSIQPFDLDTGWNLNIEPYAFYVSDDCDPSVQKAVMKRFSTIYVGCIH